MIPLRGSYDSADAEVMILLRKSYDLPAAKLRYAFGMIEIFACGKNIYYLYFSDRDLKNSEQVAQQMRAICTDLRRMLVSAIKTMKQKQTNSND